jgi:AAA+ ATPase superfamily predicted ATPase
LRKEKNTGMKFYDREKEIAALEKTEQKSLDAAQMTVLVGRRRIGKTSLLTKTFADKQAIYFFVAKKNEALLCEEYVATIQNSLNVNIFGTMKTFKDVSDI